MPNLSIIQKLNCKPLSAFRNVHHKGSKNFDIQSCVSTQEKNQIQQRRDSHWQMSSASLLPLDHIDSSDNFSNSVLYLAENRMQDTVFLTFETENWT